MEKEKERKEKMNKRDLDRKRMKEEMKKNKAKKKSGVSFEFVGPIIEDDQYTVDTGDATINSIDQSREEEVKSPSKITNFKSKPEEAKSVFTSKDKKDDEKVANMIAKRYSDYVITLEGFLDDEENVSDEEDATAETPKFIHLPSSSDRDNSYIDESSKYLLNHKL